MKRVQGASLHFMSFSPLHHTHIALLHLSPLHIIHTYQLGLEEDGFLNLCWKYTSQHPTTGPEYSPVRMIFKRYLTHFEM